MQCEPVRWGGDAALETLPLPSGKHAEPVLLQLIEPILNRLHRAHLIDWLVCHGDPVHEVLKKSANQLNLGCRQVS